MKQVYFFVGNQYLAAGDLPAQIWFRAGHKDVPQNTAFFCAACGEVWGRIVLREKQDFNIRFRFCDQHGSGLFQDNSSPLWKHYPKEVLARELRLIAKHYAENPELDFRDLTINWKRYYD